MVVNVKCELFKLLKPPNYQEQHREHVLHGNYWPDNFNMMSVVKVVPSFVLSERVSLLHSWWSYAVGWLKRGRRMSAPTNSLSTASGICLSSARRMRWSRWGSDESRESFHLASVWNLIAFIMFLLSLFVILFCHVVSRTVTVSISWDGDFPSPWVLALQLCMCVSLWVNLVTNRLVSADQIWKLSFGLGSQLQRLGLFSLLLTLSAIKSLLGFNCMTNCEFLIKVLFIFVVSIVKKELNQPCNYSSFSRTRFKGKIL